jgi:hypothetical protein
MAKQKKKKLPPVNRKPAAKVDEALSVILKPRAPATPPTWPDHPHPEPRDSATGVYVAALFILACAVAAAWGLVHYAQ